MLTRDQIKEALAQTDEKFKTPEVNREVLIDFIEGEQTNHDRKIAEWKK